MEKFKFFASLTANSTNPTTGGNNKSPNNNANVKREIKRIKLQRRLRSESCSSIGSSPRDSGSSGHNSNSSDEENQMRGRPGNNTRGNAVLSPIRRRSATFNQIVHDNKDTLNSSYFLHHSSSLSSSSTHSSYTHVLQQSTNYSNNDNNNEVVINNELNSLLTNNNESSTNEAKFKRITRKIGKLMLPKLFQQQQQQEPPLSQSDANNNSSLTDEPPSLKPKIGKIKSVFLQQVQASEQESENLDSGKENYDSGNNKSVRSVARQASFKSLDPSKIRVTPPANRKVYKYFGVTSTNVSNESNNTSHPNSSHSGTTQYYSPLTTSNSSHYLSPTTPAVSPLLDESVSRYVEQQTPHKSSIKRANDKVTSTPLMRQARRRILERYNSSRVLPLTSFEELSIDEDDLRWAESNFERLYLKIFNRK